jgi:hypothetical protein
VTLAPEAPAELGRRGGARPAGPYPGLVPFAEDDARFLFGRFDEIAVASASLRSSRLTLLYGPSGAGKSSLLHAGVVPALRREARRPDVENPFAVAVVGSWHGDPARAVEAAAGTALQELAGDEALQPPAATLAGTLRAWTDEAGALLLVLDQFEEYFRHQPDDGGGAEPAGFVAELARILDDPELAVHVLISIREDAWAKLDRLEGRVPSLFADSLRVDHLDPAAAREAIEGPVGAWNRTLPPGEEPYYVEGALVQAVLAEAAGVAFVAAASGEADPPEPGPAGRVEAAFLQLVLEPLWRETIATGSRTMELATLDSLGGARRLVESHLPDALDGLSRSEQDTAADCFRFLVGSDGSRVARSATDLAGSTRRPERRVTAVLGLLCAAESGRILRALAPGDEQPVRYELFHDVLAAPVLAWRRRHEAERTRRGYHRRARRIGIGALVLCGLFAALAAAAWIDRQHTSNLLHAQRDSNRALEARFVARAHARTAAARSQRANAVLVARLRGANGSLLRQAAQARGARDGLIAEIHLLRVRNHGLAVSIGTLDTRNTALAKQVTTLDRTYAGGTAELVTLDATHGLLAGDAAAIGAQTASLAAQRKALAATNDDLVRKAEALGGRSVAHGVSTPKTASAVPPASPETALQYTVPADVAGTDVLRSRVQSLTHRLALLVQKRARLADGAGWYRSANRLLAQQRDALRQEAVLLDAERAKLQSRNDALRQNRDAAAAEHTRLTARRDAATARDAKQAKTIAARRKTNGTLQDRANLQASQLGAAQAEIAQLTADNSSLASFVEGKLGRVLRGASSAATDPKLAGLLAVAADRLAPYDPDDPAHPSVYNALWLALDHLDAATAQALVAPAASPAGKVGTTTSARLVRALCARVPPALTRAEWSSWLPPGAPYAQPWARPCG